VTPSFSQFEMMDGKTTSKLVDPEELKMPSKLETTRNQKNSGEINKIFGQLRQLKNQNDYPKLQLLA
jgi:hypothetical protein